MTTARSVIGRIAEQQAEVSLCLLAYEHGLTFTDEEFTARQIELAQLIATQLLAASVVANLARVNAQVAEVNGA